MRCKLSCKFGFFCVCVLTGPSDVYIILYIINGTFVPVNVPARPVARHLSASFRPSVSVSY